MSSPAPAHDERDEDDDLLTYEMMNRLEDHLDEELDEDDAVISRRRHRHIRLIRRTSQPMCMFTLTPIPILT